MTHDVAPHEHGLVRMFTVTAELARALHDGADLAALLGADPGSFDGAHADLIAPAELGGLGLAGYLTEGLGIAPDQLDAQALAAIDGPVLLVRSSAFGGQAQTLAPAPGLTLVAQFEEPRDDLTQRPLASEAAAGTLAAGDVPRPSQGRMMGRVAMVALAVMLALVVLMIVVGG